MWIDATKGLAIALVVLGHVLGGVLAREWLPASPWRSVYEFIYLFHMPAFFMISGLLLHDAALARPMAAIVSRIGTVLWPYCLWDVAVRWLLLPYISRFMGSAPDNIGALEWLWKALTGELSWFFWTLFLVQLLFVVLVRIPGWLLLGASVVIALMTAKVELGPLRNLIDYMPFLVLGAMARPCLGKLETSGGLSPLAATLLAFAGIALAVSQGWTAIPAIKLACSFLGIFALVAFVQCFPRALQAGMLSSLGMASLAIYVLHPYFQGATRTIIAAFLGASPLVQLVLPTIVAIAGPYLVWMAANRLGMPWLFQLRLKWAGAN